jgi:dihydroxyacetone kinase phosphotransfer subunit
MVNLVIVSHSYFLAEGARELALQMAAQAVQIAAVGGIVTDGGHALGTDVSRIAEAVRELFTSDGVLLLVDMGSSVMSAEEALERLPAEMRSLCLVSDAPLVEGAILAALEAGLGRSLVDVNAAAESACTAAKR